MNPERFPDEDIALEKTEVDATERLPEQIDFFKFPHARLEEIERSQSRHVHELKDAVASMPEHSSEMHEAMSIFQRFNQEVNKKMRMLVVAASLFSPLAAQAHENVNDTGEGTRIESVESHSGEVAESLDELKQRVWSDDFETLIIHFGPRGSEEEIIEVKGLSDTPFVNMIHVEQERIQEMRKEISRISSEHDADKLTGVMQHNHPVDILAESYGIDEEDLEKMRSGEIPAIVLPPSIVDLFDSTDKAREFDIVNHVAEPSGTWTYERDEGHPVVKIVEQEAREHRQGLNNEAYMTGADEYEEKFDEHLKTVVGDLLLEIERKVQELCDISYADTVSAIRVTAEEIRSKSAKGEDVSELIESYIAQAESLGVHVEYHPQHAP